MSDSSSTSHTIAPPIDQTQFEYVSDAILGLVFLILVLVSAQRLFWSRKQGGSETTVVTAFYSLILATSVLRSVWFLIPHTTFEPSYVPRAVFAFDSDHPSWVGACIDQVFQTAGSTCLFSIFVLILVYWADILKKYFYPGARRVKPMHTFLTLVAFLIVLEAVNVVLFLAKYYSSEAMILVDSILLATVSTVCVVEITIFSHRFRTVLKTLGAINQVSTESQVKRIVWITVTGNAFFVTRALLELSFCICLIAYWKTHGSVAKVFGHDIWDAYVLLKFWCEIMILSLMLYILQSRFAGSAGTSAPAATTTTSGAPPPKKGYQSIPESVDVEGGRGRAPKVPNTRPGADVTTKLVV